MSFVSRILFKIANAFLNAGIFVWDIIITLLNLVLPKRAVGHVTPESHPGYHGYWPEYKPAQEGDSRCSCPALNAMANHGILPRNGRGITFKEMNAKIRTTYNFAPTFCLFVPNFAANMLNKSYRTDTFDLEELDLHNGIEHDASLTRVDTAANPNQSVIHAPFVEELLGSASGKAADGHQLLTSKDLSRISGKRRVEARANNPDYTLSLFHKMFGSSNSSTLLTIFGGRVEDLRSVLLEERLPSGWESRIRQPYGLTMCNFNKTVLAVEFGIKEKDHPVPDSNKQDNV
ncbi:hypothetical protein SERLA73DRAFT_179182 [Serpula lacrymans var. lacrymans S7.3]|uniref:Heme haloperoxidase family profile domain-containing protein n=2 Tax=Serpula lacrymans var. lacrymans TaxID=341189 RepID=F8PRI8_SERL3|nr:uncharacterized protein SERLADRAFT_464182 [Serpula lacrymans var. lacrymans S7.9]EGO01127.1 hypothetical protein SERLA73DRAFT_179182 [Serpula lacrymans var. lacrymans S7.3]EGO26778.1 hypothetical protein SERLADRAFT_464182 [Serpula lacrymans var. lacrymans S7.9]